MGFKNGVVPPLLRTRECKKAFKEITLHDFSLWLSFLLWKLSLKMQIFVIMLHTSLIWICFLILIGCQPTVLFDIVCREWTIRMLWHFYLVWVWYCSGLSRCWEDQCNTRSTVLRALCLLGELFVPWAPLSQRMLRDAQCVGHAGTAVPADAEDLMSCWREGFV